MRRHLVFLAAAAAVFLAILPFSSEPNPEYERAQAVLDRLAAATGAIRDGSLEADGVGAAHPGISAATGLLADGATGTVVVAVHDERCFVVYWSTAAVSGPRAGTLDPGLECAVGPALLATLPAPPLVEVFPGTVPPLDATALQSPVGAPRHGTFDPYAAERTPGWFVAAAAALFAVALWQLVSITILLLSRNPRRRSPSSPRPALQ